MPKTHAAPGTNLLENWRRCKNVPGGRWLFSKMVGWMAPYTGTIGAKVEELRPGFVKVTLRDRRAVRNHLNSIHAIALINLGEVASGLAMLTALPPGVRGIVTHIEMDYLKKARGKLTATSTVDVPSDISTDTELDITAQIHNADGELVARAGVRWKLSPPKD